VATDRIAIRAVRNDDSAGIIELVAACFADYPGCVLDVDAEEPELRAPADSFERMWVAEATGRVVGMIAAKRHGDAVELKKLYIEHAARGSGLARRLVDLVEGYARESGATSVDLWSDTRFDKAHVVYEHFGYVRQTRIRDLHDKSNTREYYFTKSLAGS
jgi:putative acetyltransferase